MAEIEAKMWWDHPRRRLHFRMAGFWTDAVVKEWQRTTADAMRSAPRGGWSFLGDLTDFPAQDESIVDSRRQLVQMLIDNGCTAGAYITPKVIIKMQSQRLASTLDPHRFGFFATREEAEDFLGRVAQPGPTS